MVSDRDTVDIIEDTSKSARTNLSQEAVQTLAKARVGDVLPSPTNKLRDEENPCKLGCTMKMRQW